MPDPLLVTKVSLPKLRHILVPRAKVLRRLSEGVQDGHLLTPVNAPAGHGKTANDLKQFLIYILSALQRAASEDLGQAARKLVENTQEMNLQRILGALINNLYDLEQPIIPVLDSVYLLTANRRHKWIPQLNPNKVN